MYYRKRWGKGFTYRNESGETIKDKDLKSYFNSLVIPPAWTDVKIDEDKNAKVLATGRDTADRKQYIYNPNYLEAQQEKKFSRIIRFAEKLETMRRVTGQHLRAKELTKNKVCATMLRLMDQAYFRPGNKYYSDKNGSFGITTMRSKHLTIKGDTLEFNYTGKSGMEQNKEIEDERLASIVKELDELSGYRIFKYIDESGTKNEISSSDLNEYIHNVMGEEFSAKDFRTWAGTLVAAIALDEFGAEMISEQKDLDKNIRDAIIRVSELLGNTPSVARNSYIDPRIIENYLDGRTVSFFANEADKLLEQGNRLRKDERLVLCMLRAQK